jgi:hypothetical protein
MTNVAICTSVYPVHPEFAAAFADGIAAASAAGVEITVLLAVEPGTDTAAMAARLPRGVDVELRRANGTTTPASLRRFMVESAVRLSAEFVVFCDLDDRLRPNAVELHLAALAEADISYGDMVLVDAAGRSLGSTFFEGADVPSVVNGAASLLDCNFMGFTNTSVRRSALSRDACAIPEAAAAADWWFFTMLLASGRVARRAAGPVVDYRQHGANALGAGPADTVVRLRNHAALALDHYRLLPEQLDTRERQVVLRRLIDAIDRGGADAARLLSRAAAGTGVWFDDVRRARDAFVEPGFLPAAGTA